MIAKWKWHIGEINKHYDSPYADRRLPANRHKNYARYTTYLRLEETRNSLNMCKWI